MGPSILHVIILMWCKSASHICKCTFQQQLIYFVSYVKLNQLICTTKHCCLYLVVLDKQEYLEGIFILLNHFIIKKTEIN